MKIIGDFNVVVSDPHMNNFCNAYNFSNFIDICMRSLDKHAPLKKKYICDNHLLFCE